MFERAFLRARATRALCVVVWLLHACGGDDAKSKDTAVTSSGSAGSQSTRASELAGTGNDCESYTMPQADKCGSWYCGITLPKLESAIDAAAVCGSSAELICSGSAVTAVADCARMIKLSMPFASNEQLRPMVRDCALQNAQLAGTRSACLDCIFDGFACTADNCLVQCLAGNSPDCDQCRLKAKCDQTSFECAGLPWPRS